MFILKVIFVILLLIPLIILAFILLNRLFDTAIKYKEEFPENENKSKRNRKRRRRR